MLAVLVFTLLQKTKADSDQKYSAEEDIWVQGGGSNWKLEAVHDEELHDLYWGGIWHIWGSREMHTGNERDNWEDLSIYRLVCRLAAVFHFKVQ